MSTNAIIAIIIACIATFSCISLYRAFHHPHVKALQNNKLSYKELHELLWDYEYQPFALKFAIRKALESTILDEETANLIYSFTQDRKFAVSLLKNKSLPSSVFSNYLFEYYTIMHHIPTGTEKTVKKPNHEIHKFVKQYLETANFTNREFNVFSIMAYPAFIYKAVLNNPNLPSELIPKITVFAENKHPLQHLCHDEVRMSTQL